MPHSAILLISFACLASLAAQTPAPAGKADKVEVSPARAEAEVGQTLKFSAAASDASGARLDAEALDLGRRPVRFGRR